MKWKLFPFIRHFCDRCAWVMYDNVAICGVQLAKYCLLLGCQYHRTLPPPSAHLATCFVLNITFISLLISPLTCVHDINQFRGTVINCYLLQQYFITMKYRSYVEDFYLIKIQFNTCNETKITLKQGKWIFDKKFTSLKLWGTLVSYGLLCLSIEKGM